MKRVRAFQIELEIGSAGFYGEGKTGLSGQKPLGARERTNNKLNPHKASTPGFEPGPHWWEASALTTTPPLLSYIGHIGLMPSTLPTKSMKGRHQGELPVAESRSSFTSRKIGSTRNLFEARFQWNLCSGNTLGTQASVPSFEVSPE